MSPALKIVFKKFSPVILVLIVATLISTITRLTILLSFENIQSSFLTVGELFLVGLVYDLLVAGILSLPFAFHISLTNNYAYSKKGRWIAVLAFLAIISLFLFTSIVPEEFNADLFKALVGLIILRFAIFLLLLASPPKFRYQWRKGLILTFFSLTVFLLIFNAVSEWFFWNEFSSRYNFIAVDYLVYTNEVIGNIVESYPIVPIVAGVLLLSALLTLTVKRQLTRSVAVPVPAGRRFLFTGILSLGLAAMAFLLPANLNYFSRNNYVNELAGNGMYSFVEAFKNNELDFFRYYDTIPDKEAFHIMRGELADAYSRFLSSNDNDLRREITSPLPENKMNVVLISVESLSANYLQQFGDPYNLTPNLNSLSEKGMTFQRLYASGTRTVRGLEAISLSLPPLPGQSLIKRKNNEQLFTLGSVLKAHGYTTQYIYGGYSYFDNMKGFFGRNNYEVIDRDSILPAQIHYSNIWGVADEDLFTLATKKMDENFSKEKPFFTHIMTVSNHRPYTYPEGRIDIPPTEHSRGGAVKYTDFAIGKFLKDAESRPWFKNTIFVIVADHCASSAGSQDLPLSGYHIPMIIYSPFNIAPQKIGSLMSQIDIAPTILGMLHLKYESQFLGRNIFVTPPEKQRAFLSTYQGLGFLRNDTLVVQSPVRKIRAYKVHENSDSLTEITLPLQLKNSSIAYYQTASWLIKRNRYRAGRS